MGRRVRTLEERFWAKVDKAGGYPPAPHRIVAGQCWVWTASGKGNGYGQFWVNGAYELAHRVAWSLRYGPIPDDREVDHLCRRRECVNPGHMELVTHKVNSVRASLHRVYALAERCCRNHDLTDPANVYVYYRKNGRRVRRCRPCTALLTRRYREQRRTA